MNLHIRAAAESSTARIAVVFVLALAFTGCASLDEGDYVRPEVAYTNTFSREAAELAVVPEWWREFGDPYLNELIDQALQSNIDLAILASRLETASATIDQAGASRLPSFVNTSGTDNYGSPEIDRPYNARYSTGNEMNWEIDVWGKAKKGIQAQEAAYKATEAELRAAYLTIVAQVASTYFQIRQYDEQIDQQQGAITRNMQALQIYRNMQDHGLRTAQDVYLQQAEVSALQADLIELDRERELAEVSLAELLGQQPGTLSVPRSDTPISQVTVPVGLPSDLVGRRPDIIAAEYRILQNLNLEGQARLAQLPSFGMTGRVGTAGFDLADVGNAFTFGLSNFTSWPIFDPNVRARIKVSEKQVGEAEQQYRGVVQRSFKEVESALTNLTSREAQRIQLIERHEQTLQARRIEQKKLDAGRSHLLGLLEQERSLLRAERALSANRWAIVNDTVALYKAVGGGWPEHVVAMD